MTTRDDNPKVFISYSWSGVEHQEFVLNLAEKLMSDGVLFGQSPRVRPERKLMKT